MRQLIPLGRALVLGLLLAGLTTGTPGAKAATPGILITEVQAANTRTVSDDRGRYADWIELHNPTAAPVSLAGYTLTDDPDRAGQVGLAGYYPGARGLPGGVGVRGPTGWGIGRLAHELPD